MREYQNGAVVTPNDTTDLSVPSLALMVTTSGTVKVDMIRGGTVTVTLNVGTIYPLHVRRVYATGTTATGIVQLF